MRYQKVFVIAIAITGILLVVFLSQLAETGTSWGADERQSEPTPTEMPLALIPTIARATPTLMAPTPIPVHVTREMSAAAPTEAPLEPAAPPPQADRASTTQTLFHTVQAGETLIQIAETYGISADTIISRNRLPESGAINTGQLLLIPILRPTPTPAAPAIQVNGLPVDSFIVIPPDVQEHIQAIYDRGRSLGRDPHSMSVIGDSTVEMLNFLTGFETVRYNLGDFAYLDPLLTYYAGSYARPRMAVEKGIHSRQVFLDVYADPQYCQPGESMIDCEWRLHNPSVVLIRIGSNDGKPDLFDREMRRMVEYVLEKGTVPIIGTKADEYLDPGYVNNEILRQIARDYRLPLWDFQLVAQTLPDNGLLYDRVHLTLFHEFDWTKGEAFRTGHGLQNLTALMALDAVLDIVSERSTR